MGFCAEQGSVSAQIAPSKAFFTKKEKLSRQARRKLSSGDTKYTKEPGINWFLKKVVEGETEI